MPVSPPDWQDSPLAGAWLAAIVDSSDDVIISKTLDGIIMSWNRAAERMFEWAAAEAVGRHITLIVPAERLAEEEQVLAQLRRGERLDHFETVRISRSGQLRDVSITVSPIRDAAGRIVGASKIARDIGERRRLEAAREAVLVSERAVRDELEAAARAKDDFLTTLSHELRTPLNAILGWAQILRHTRHDAQVMDRAVESIVRNAELQARLVADLLDVSAILSGRLRLFMESVDLNRVLAAAVDSLRPAAEAKGIELRLRASHHVGLMRGDPTRLHQIIRNLLSNAIKFTEREGVVTLGLQEDSSEAVLTVSDTGIGIPADVLPTIFDRFRQGDSSITREHGGLGLGLAIVKQLVELHGGTVRAASPGKGQGAEFTVALPLRQAVAGQAQERSDSIGRCDGVSVLVVDDDTESRLVMQALLEQCGARATLAASADEAWIRLREMASSPPGVLICDLAMPHTDGYEFMREVRRSLHGRGRPSAIALTAHASPDARLRAFEAGFDTFLMKPIEAAELVAAVAALARRTWES